MPSGIVVKPKAGDAAVAKASQTIIFMVDAALGRLHDLGYDRGYDDLQIDPRDGFPLIRLGERILFEVDLVVDPNRGISIDGNWVYEPPKKSWVWLIKAYRWLRKRVGLARAA